MVARTAAYIFRWENLRERPRRRWEDNIKTDRQEVEVRREFD